MALDFIAGCLGGCAGILVGHPLDTVKVHIQTQDARNPRYKGTFHCLRTIYQKESFRGLYRGMSSPMAGVAFVNAIVFGVYGNVQRNSEDPNSLKSHFVAGSAAGLIQSLICSPMELAKTRIQLQDQSCKVKHKGPLECLLHVNRTEGMRGVFRGLGLTAARDVPGFASYFVAYEVLTRNTPNPHPLMILLSGGLAGAFSWLLSFPVDVVKSRLQADGLSGKRQYTGVLDCMQQGYRNNGITFYTRGLSSALIRAFPMNAACFFVVSWVMKFLDKCNVDIEVTTQAEPMTVVGSLSRSMNHHCYVHIHELEHKKRQETRSNTIKSLSFLGAFSEAVCSSEIVDLVNDLYDDQYNYFDFNSDDDLEHTSCLCSKNDSQIIGIQPQ